MAVQDPPVTAHHLTTAVLSVAVVIDAMIKVANLDRAAIASFIQQANASLSAENRAGSFGQLLDLWTKVVEQKIHPSTFH